LAVRYPVQELLKTTLELYAEISKLYREPALMDRRWQSQAMGLPIWVEPRLISPQLWGRFIFL